MSNSQEHLDAIKDMRNMMEKSTKFLSFSGLAGVAVGIIALLGITVFCIAFSLSPLDRAYYHVIISDSGIINDDALSFLIKDALIVFLLSAGIETWMAYRKSKKIYAPIWDSTSKRMLLNILIPFVTGIIFCLILMGRKEISLLAPASLIFYGLALVNVSKYTIDQIRSMGIIQVILGLASAWWVDLGLINWAIGFGVLHILYGLFIYSKHEK